MSEMNMPLTFGTEVEGLLINEQSMKNIDNNSIIIRQNEEASVRRWTAQNKLYKRAKRTSASSFLICVIPIVIMGVAKLWLGGNETYRTFFIIYGSFATVLKILLDYHEDDLRKLAARIQQQYDTYIFGMKWDKLWGQAPTTNDVMIASKGEKNNKAINWYEVEIGKANSSVGVLLCQMENVSYEKNLKGEFYTYCGILFWGLLAALAAGGIIYDTGMFQFLMSFIIPMVPIGVWYYKLRKVKQREEEKRKDCLHLIQEAYDSAKRTGNVSNQKLYRIQTALFNYRSIAKPLPEFLYKIFRKSNEDDAYYTTKLRLNELNIK